MNMNDGKANGVLLLNSNAMGMLQMKVEKSAGFENKMNNWFQHPFTDTRFFFFL